MRGLKKAEVPVPAGGDSKESIATVTRWLDQGGSVAKAFKESLEVGQLLAEDVLIVLAASNALVQAGRLTPRAIALLTQDLMPRPHGRPALSIQQILDVLEALTRLGEHLLDEEGKEKKKT